MGLLQRYFDSQAAKRRAAFEAMTPEQQKAYTAELQAKLKERLPIKDEPSQPVLDGELRWRLRAAPDPLSRAGYRDWFYFYRQLDGVRWCCGRCQNAPTIALRFRPWGYGYPASHGQSKYAFRCLRCHLTVAYDFIAAHTMLDRINAPQVDKHYQRDVERQERLRERALAKIQKS